MINKEILTIQYSELQDLYKQLDLIIEGNIYMLSLLDNKHNSYAYSDRLRLFDALDICIKGYSQYSDMEFANRIIHFITIQDELFNSFIIDQQLALEDGLMPLLNEESIELLISINKAMQEIIPTLVSSLHIEELATYVFNLVNAVRGKR